MNYNFNSKATGGYHDPELEEIIRKKDAELKELAKKNARHFAVKNLPAQGDDIAPFTGDIKAGYEKLAADALHRSQPLALGTESKMEADFLRDQDKTLTSEIKERENLNHQSNHIIDGYNPGGIPARIAIAVTLTLIIYIGDTAYNSKALQIISDNFLFALLLSICISVAVFAFSHFAPFVYKAAKTKLQRRLVVLGSLGLITALFTALAIFRSQYATAHDERAVNPAYFVLLNLFLFVVSALVSLFLIPTWAELKQNFPLLKHYRIVKKREKEIVKLKKEKENIKAVVLKKTTHRMHIVHSSAQTSERIRKMYKEAIEAFKMTNLIFRTDGVTPQSFSDDSPDLDIDNDFPIFS